MFERILTSVVKIIKSSLTLEANTKRRGVLQRLDPRFVFLTLIALVVISVLLRNMTSVIIMIILSISLAVLSKVPLGWFLKRVWLFVPLFTTVIMLPAMTNLITPGENILTILKFNSIDIYFTGPGVYNGIIFTLRVGAAVSFCILLVSTVEWSRLMKALYDLKFPRSFVLMLDMTYRYIHLLLDIVMKMFMARKSRMTGKSDSKEIRLIGGSTVTGLFARSFQMSEQIYLAMTARGYTGKPLMLTELRYRNRDIIFMISMLMIGIIVVLNDSKWIAWIALDPRNLIGWF
jgi:cobalt/nickel transport system permease protein